MARRVEREESLDGRAVGEFHGILGVAGELLETAEKEDLHANCL